MYSISPIFTDSIRRLDKTYKVKALIAGTEYTGSSIVEFSVEDILAAGDEFEIGTAIPSKLTIKLRLPDPIPSNAQVIPYLALSLDGMSWADAKYPWQDMNIPWASGMTEWLPLGEFYVDNREKINDVWTYTCYDKLITADVAYISQLSYPTSQKAVFDEICSRLGLRYDSSVLINPGYMIQAGPAGYSCRQVLANIAGANGASIYMGKEGVMRFKRFAAVEPAAVELTTSDYIRVKQTNPLKTFTRIVVTYNTEDQLTYEAGSGDENHTLYIENPFMTQAQVNSLYVQLNGLTYLPLDMSARGFPQFDQGDVISFEQREGGSWIDTNVAWQDMHVPWDGIQRYTSYILRQTFSYKGGLTHKIEAPSKSEQQSEFALEGSLTQQVNRLNRNAVRYGKPYFGITHSRTEGFIVEREDHLSRLQLNSDVMDWEVNNQSMLYLDAQAKKLKFAGTLEGVDGIFSGTVQGGKIIGGSVQIGSAFSVNNAGHMIAVGAEFSGTISASIITGGQINGTNITGADILGGRIRTAVSGERIVLDPYGFEFFDSSNAKRVSLGTNQVANISGHTYWNSSSQPMGLIYANPSEFHVMGNQNLRVGTNSGGSLILQGPVYFTNGSVTGLSLTISQIAGLRSELESIKSQLANHTHIVNIGTHNHGNTANQNWGGTFTTSTP